jgi:ABC-type transport system involved in cytochrome c biogenesis permease subunit
MFEETDDGKRKTVRANFKGRDAAMAADVTALRESTLAEHHYAEPQSTAKAVLLSVIHGLASLKLTVVLFALSIVLVFVSTLAQTEHDIWQIVNEWYRIDERKVFTGDAPYFHPGELLVWIRFQYFFPASFFPDMAPVGGGFWFPRGWLIGMLMGINLLAAHMVRFTANARGARLAAGLALIVLGAGATALAIQSGSSAEGILGGAAIEWDTFRKLLTMSLATLVIVLAGLAFFLPSRRVVERVCSGLGAALCIAPLWYVLYYGREGHIEDESARILWQLVKGTGAGLLLLAGCRLVFNKRAGIVLLHAGVGLMFAYEVIVGTSHQESQMTIMEGQTSNWVQDTRSAEFVVTRKPLADEKGALDKAVVVPQSRLDESEVVELPDQVPFNIRVVKYVRNSKLAELSKSLPNEATEGLGTQIGIAAVEPGTGTDMSGGVDMPSMYVDLVNKADGKSLGVYLVSWNISLRDGVPEQEVEVGKRKYAIDLRPKRTYKPYDITLIEVRKDDYVAGDKPRNYSSALRVVDPTRKIDREETIWMNNPMRFADATFYQSGYNQMPDGRKLSTIQVVENVGWMLPYVSCMIVVVGCIAQFGTTLMRFLNRRQVETNPEAVAGAALPASSSRIPAAARKAAAKNPIPQSFPAAATPGLKYGVPAVAALVVVLFAASRMRVPAPAEGEMDLYEFGTLPVAYQDRVKPMDSLARYTLAYLSHRQTFKRDYDDKDEKAKPAIVWLLDLITDMPRANNYPVFKIDNLEVQQTLGLKHNQSSRYSYNQIEKAKDKLKELKEVARSKGKRVNSFDREIVKLDERLSTYQLIASAFLDPDFQPISEADMKADPEAFAAKFSKLREQIGYIRFVVEQMNEQGAKPPLAIPEGAEKWHMYTAANLADFVATNFPKAGTEGASPATKDFRAILTAYRNNDAAGFNKALAAYRTYLDGHPPHEYDRPRRDQESYLNAVEPFWYLSLMYLVGFAFSCFGWLGYGRLFNRISFGVILSTLILHAAAIGWRIYITERPPVINLYSSAVFIAAAAALFGVGFEWVYKLGVGNVGSGLAGFGSLQIAHILSLQGDHVESLQAVLDTQFWLTTHVVCITIGYAVTYFAGLLGAIYVLWSLVPNAMSQETSKEVSRMIYGMLCFALVFSFFGTVLGGLWADDSWGRFWGWDPKENGALIIVLWNALVLHARWDGMVKDRGLAVLAVGGNIATSWSWFGVNQLGVGLHAYGFSQELLNVLVGFVGASALIVLLGLIPRKLSSSAN